MKRTLPSGSNPALPLLALILPAALLLAAILLSGCAVTPLPGASNASSNASSSSISNPAPGTPQAEAQALKTEVEGLQASQRSLQNRLNDELRRTNYTGAQESMQAMADLSALLAPKLDELCRRQDRKCDQELFAVRRWAPCASNFSIYAGLRQAYLDAHATLQDCRQSCGSGAAAAACLYGCNPALRALQDSCPPLQESIAYVSQACGPSLDESLYTDLQLQNINCESLAIQQPYPAPVNASGRGEAPSVAGSAAIDLSGGAYSTKSCSIQVSPSVLLAGKDTLVTIYAYAGSGERITYSCGDGEPRSAGSGGLLGPTSRVCTYNDVGPTSVWVALDGYVCASTPLDVESPNVAFHPSSCRIAANSRSMGREGTTTTYWASLLVRHQAQNALVRWGCGSQSFNVPLSMFWNGSDISGALNLSCTFNEWSPSNAPGRASVGGQDCGTLSAEG